MKRLITLSLLTTLIACNVSVIEPDVQTNEWSISLGSSKSDQIYSINTTNDGGYIAAGNTYSNDHGQLTGDCWIIKLNKSGEILWQKKQGGSATEKAYSIQQSNDGGFIYVGYTLSSNGDVLGLQHAAPESWVVKLDEGGNILWQKSLGGIGGDFAYSVSQTNDGGYIIAGSTDSNDGDVSGWHTGYDAWGGATFDFWIVKIDNNGNIQWQKCLGGSNHDQAYSIVQTNDGGYIVTGMTESNDGDVSKNHDNTGITSDIWVVKLDSNGNISWEKCLGGTYDDKANSVLQTTNGNYIVAGWTESDDGDVIGNHGGKDSWVIELNNSGEILWKNRIGGNNDEEAHSIIQTQNGNYIISGWSESNNGDLTGNHGMSDYFIVEIDNSGTIEDLNSIAEDVSVAIIVIENTKNKGRDYHGE